jgi:hypothetical protein
MKKKARTGLRSKDRRQAEAVLSVTRVGLRHVRSTERGKESSDGSVRLTRSCRELYSVRLRTFGY